MAGAGRDPLPTILSLDDVRFVGPEAEEQYRADAREIEALPRVPDGRDAWRRCGGVTTAPVFGTVRVWTSWRCWRRASTRATSACSA